ncbi:MAG: SDR family oxidoreductase [bacterium]
MSNQILITGANRGIGLELAKQLHTQGHKITAICRHSSPDIEAIASQVISNIDIREKKDIQSAKNSCECNSFDILINNAGVLQNENIQHLDSTSVFQIKNQFITNSLAPLLITHHFLDTLKENSKLILITSRMGSIADNDSGGRYGYRMSKAALNAAGKSLSIDLKEQGIAVGIFHPGWVQTQMTGYSGPLTVQESAKNLITRIEALNLENSGQFLHSNGESLPW